jgi:hypothetical protein
MPRGWWRFASINLALGSAPGRSHRARWLWPFHHNHEKHSALMPPANPAYAPAINVIANRDFSEEPQKLSLNLHGDPCISAGMSSQAALAANFAFNKSPDRIKRSIRLAEWDAAIEEFRLPKTALRSDYGFILGPYRTKRPMIHSTNPTKPRASQ